jgi:hypothetical protein
MPYDIVPYEPELEPEIVHFCGAHAAYFRWKYAENPFLDQTILQLAVSGGRVVAMRGMFGAVWQVDEPSTGHRSPVRRRFRGRPGTPQPRRRAPRARGGGRGGRPPRLPFRPEP